MYVKTLAKIASRYAPSRILSFDSVHVFIVLQLIEKKGHVSRNLLCKELSLGEGSVKTLVKHLQRLSLGIMKATSLAQQLLRGREKKGYPEQLCLQCRRNGIKKLFCCFR